MVNEFKDELIDLWTDFYNTDKIYDLIFVNDYLIEVKCENKKVANEFADFIMTYYKASICYDFRKGNGCYQFLINPSLMIRESKKNLKESTNDDIKNYINALRTYSKKDVPSYSKSYYFWSYYEFNISDNEWSKVSLSGRDYAKSLKDANNLAKSDDIVKAYLVFKNPNNPNESFKVIIKENNFYESKKFTKRSLKESTDEDFSLYDLNKHDPFVKEWIKNINKELADVSIDSIGDDEIVFRVWVDKSIDLNVFDDIVTSCMPRTLIEFMSDMNIDFGYQFVYKDDKFTENDYVFIRFVAW